MKRVVGGLVALVVGLALAQPAAASGGGGGDRTLERYAEGTWRSFAAMTDERTGFPSDILESDGTRSVQTSNTNIGAYMWSAVVGRAARDHPPLGAGRPHAPHDHHARGHRAPRAERPVLQLVRPPDGREADGLAAVRRTADPDPLLGRQRLAGGRPARSSPPACPSCRAARATSTTPWTSASTTGRRATRCCSTTCPTPAARPAATTRSSARAGSPPTSGSPGSRSRSASTSARTGRGRTPATPPGPRRGRSASRAPTSARRSTTARCPYNDTLVTPSWGGSMFEALMPSLFVPEETWAPGSWGANHPLVVAAQIHHGLREAGYGYWGFSPVQRARGRLPDLRRRRHRHRLRRLPVEQRRHDDRPRLAGLPEPPGAARPAAERVHQRRRHAARRVPGPALRRRRRRSPTCGGSSATSTSTRTGASSTRSTSTAAWCRTRSSRSTRA